MTVARSRGPWIAAGISLLAAVGAIVALVIVLNGRGSSAPITDQSLCRDVAALGSDPGNQEEHYLALNEALGVRSGFEQVCQQNPEMPVTEALRLAPNAEAAFQASVTP